MEQNSLRTFRRRKVTRRSGYHANGEFTGSEAKVIPAEKYLMKENRETFHFFRDEVLMTNLFDKDIGIISFGGYIYSSKSFKLTYELSYEISGNTYNFVKEITNPYDEKIWHKVGIHKEISLDIIELDDLIELDPEFILENVSLKLTVTTEVTAQLEFLSFDFDAINKEEFIDTVFSKSFYQKTNMHIPYVYYLETELSFNESLKNEVELESGQMMVLKSCNRCGRFSPINIGSELNPLAYSLHCKKRAPCTHRNFREYKILNYEMLTEEEISELPIKNKKIQTYYGHQLECRACKKFFVNAPLNPQRNAQQFKEDGLRRRAIEVLVNKLLNKNLIHFEFEQKTKKEFSEHIWKKFDKKCFKCKRTIRLDEMHLDHTRPLAYLYRLDEYATCLCSDHNLSKHDFFPVDYYSSSELIELSEITGLSLEELMTREANKEIVDLMIEHVVWYFDDFLMDPQYQKIRDGIKTSDKINDSIKRVIGHKYDLANEYYQRTGKYPNSVTIIK